MSWTDERIAELSRLWQAGHSASEIGKRLGVSKNAVVGKAHRLKLPGRPSPIKQTEVPRNQPAKRKPAAAKPTVQAAPPRTRVEGGGGGPGCLWPIGDPGDTDFHFCGEEVVPGKPYCADHAARAYITRSRDRSEEAA